MTGAFQTGAIRDGGSREAVVPVSGKARGRNVSSETANDPDVRLRVRLSAPRASIDHGRFAQVCAGQGQHAELVSNSARETIAQEYDHLNESQRAAVQEILANRDQVMALEGAAGTGKTTALTAIRDAAERDGYQVEGFAPTSRAAHNLAEAGIETSTIQHHPARGDDHAPATDEKRLYVLDESCLAITKQMHTFLERLGPDKEGDGVRYSRGSRAVGVQAGDFARVETRRCEEQPAHSQNR